MLHFNHYACNYKQIACEVRQKGGVMAQVKTQLPSGGVKVSRDIAQSLADLAEFREAFNAVKKQTDDIRKTVLEIVGDEISSVLYHNGKVVGSVDVKPTTSIDTKKLEREFPEAYEACLKAGKRVTLNTK